MNGKIKEKYNIKVITALTISSQKDVDIYKDYGEVSDLILFDGKGYEKSIGFNHELLNTIPNSINKMIAGNIKIEDISKFKNKDYFIDLSSSLENENGKKDLNKINKLLNFAVKKLAGFGFKAVPANPSPLPLSPWQIAQYCAYNVLPCLVALTSFFKGFSIASALLGATQAFWEKLFEATETTKITNKIVVKFFILLFLI